jgi:hypothetical protein
MRKPYKLITTNHPDKTLGEGHIRHYATMLQAANALVKDTAPYQQIVYDDGDTARELNDGERRMLFDVCDILGYDIEDVAG